MPSATHAHTTPTTNTTSVTPATPRRALFGAAVLLALAVPGRAADHNPDAELLALCAEFDELNRQANTLPDEGERTWEDAQAERWEVSDELQPIQPMTMEGHLAKVRVALTLMEEEVGHSQISCSSYEMFALATLRDIARLAERA